MEDSIYKKGESPVDKFEAEWRWYTVLNRLSGGDILKEDAISRLPIRQVLTKLSYLTRLSQIDEERRLASTARQAMSKRR